MFAGLTKDRQTIPTGYLWDIAVNLIEGEDYNGIDYPDTNYVDLPRLYDMIISINSASVWADTIPASHVIARIQDSSSYYNATVGVLFKPYNYIVANALQDSLITYTNQVVSDKYINGIWQNPYGEAVLVGHAIGNNGTVYQQAGFTLQNVEEEEDSLSRQTFSSIEFDAGDGSGFHPVSFGTPLSVHYPQAKYYVTTLKLVTGGSTYLSHSIVNVLPNPISPSGGSSSSRYIFQPIDTLQHQAMITYESTATFDNPLIIAESFDPWILSPYIERTDTSLHSYSGIRDYRIFENMSILSGFDIFYVDWRDYGADIRTNALLLEAAIKWINKHKTSGHANVVLGQSMGGLIARYCLCDMEKKGVPHNTRMYISHDAPHRGASVSPGLQYLFWDLCGTEFISRKVFSAIGMEDLFDEALRLGTYTSVRQMLPVYLNSSGVYDNSVYNSFQTVLDNIGFPRGDTGQPIENVAIVNGGRYAGGTTSLYNSGDRIIHISANSSTGIATELLLSFLHTAPSFFWIPDGSTISFSYDVMPYLYNSSIARELELSYTKRLQWHNDITYYLAHEIGYTPGLGTCFDELSGSCYVADIYSILPLNPGHGPEFPWSLFATYDYELAVKDSICFIPVASALNSTDYYNDFYTQSGTSIINSPFDSYFLNYESSDHISIPIGLDVWLPDVLSEVHVPPVLFNGDTLRISGAVSPFTWSCSSPSAIINNGIVQNAPDGLTTFTASRSSIGRAITKTRKSIVGFPVETLSYQLTDTGGYIIRASTSDIETDRLVNQATQQDILQFHWGIKKGTVTEWRDSPNDTIHVCIPDSLNHVTIYMSLKHGNSESPQRELQVRRPVSFNINLDRIEFNPSSGFMAFIENPSYSFPTLTSYYRVPCLMFSTLSTTPVPVLTSITINNTTFQLDGTHYIPQQNGSTMIVYVFDVLFDPDFQDIVFGMGSSKAGVWFLDINLNDSGGTFQTIRVLCYKRNF